jgi:class 3 adenylate cyclase
LPLEQAADPALSWIERSTGDSERRQVAVLACVIPTPPDGHRLADPELVADALARRCAAVSAIVSRYGGTLTCSESDRHVACWGWPTARDDDTRLAVAAAMEIVGSLGGGAKCGVETGIGVTRQHACGESVNGIVGEVVAHAKELQRMAPHGEVMVSSTVCRLVAGAFDFTKHYEDSAPDGENPKGWLVLRSSIVPRRHNLPAPAPLEGRELELAALTAAWERVEDGTFCAIHIRGEAGVGKSVLVTEIRRFIESQGGAFEEAQCLPELQHLSFAPVRQLIGALRRCSNLHSDDTLPHCTAAEQRIGNDQVSLELHECVERRARAGPLAVVFEDTHWADPATTGLLAELASDRLHDRPVLLLVTSRCAQSHSNRNAGPWQVIELERLPAARLERMLQRSRIGKRLNPEKRRLIAEHADGIPLHAWELAHLCADTTEREAHHRLLAQPNRVNAALARRLDDLGVLKPLAQTGAALGRDFDCRVLAMVLGITVRTLAEHLETLADLGVLARPDARNEHRYRFVDAMMWSAATGSVPRSRRRELHARAATEMIVTFPELAETEPERVARHFDKAGDCTNAFAWWHRAAFEAATRGSPATVISHVNRALAARNLAPAACTPLQEAELLRLLSAQISALRGCASTESMAVHVRALQLISSLPSKNSDLDFEVGWGLTAISLATGNTIEALAASTRLVGMARVLGREDALLAALRMNGTAQVLSGHLSEGINCLNEVVKMYDRRRHGNLTLRYVSDPGAAALAHLANAHALAGDVDASLAAQSSGLELTASIRHNHTSANVLGVMATAAMHRGDFGGASALAHACHAICVEHGYTYWQTRAGLVLAWLTGNKSPEIGLSLIEEATRRYHSTGSGRATMLADCLLGDIAIRAGHPTRALQALTPAASGAQTARLYTPEIMRLQVLAETAIDPSTSAVGLLRLQAAESLAREHGSFTLAERAAASRTLIAARHDGKRKRT